MLSKLRICYNRIFQPVDSTWLAINRPAISSQCTVLLSDCHPANLEPCLFLLLAFRQS